MKRVLVTGATGFIGYEVAHQLAARGLRPRLMVRRPWRGALLASLDAELISGDLTSPPSLRRAVDGVDTVLHLAARASFERYELVRPTIVDGSLSLMEAARDAGVRTFVYSSSLLVYDSHTRPIDATTPTAPRVHYGRAKVEAEALLGRVAEEAGIAFAALRLPHVYGARDLLFENLRRGALVFPGRGRNLFAHLHVADAARLLIATAEQRWTGVTPVADDRATTWNEFFDVLREFYPRFRQQRVPRWLALLGTRLLEPLQRFKTGPSLHTAGAVIGWNLSLPVAPGLLWRDLDLTPRYPTIVEGIPAVLDDSVAFRWIHPMFDRG